MKTNVYSIYDEKAESYNTPFPLATDGLARRSFEEACKDVRTDLFKYPGDFTLYCIGTWDATTAKFENITPPKFIAKNIRSNKTAEELDKIEEELSKEDEKELN